MKKALTLFLFIPFYLNIFPQDFKIIESNNSHITISVDYSNSYRIKDTIILGNKFQIIKGKGLYNRIPGEPWIPEITYLLGVPHNSNPEVRILDLDQTEYTNVFIPPMPEEDPELVPFDGTNINVDIYSTNNFFPQDQVQLGESQIMRYSKIRPVILSPYQFNPVSRKLIFNKKITFRINLNQKSDPSVLPVKDLFTENLLLNTVINFEQAKNWISKKINDAFNPVDEYWYDPSKDYYKIFLKEKGIYRITFENLVNSGVPLGSGVSSSQLELFNSEQQVPIDVIDGGDGLFEPGDYFQFIGFPPPPSDYSYLNIYNQSNVYWFSYQSSDPLRYTDINGYPQNYSRTLQVNRTIIHEEQDSIFERLGYAADDNRDYWFWGSATAQNRQASFGFEDIFNEFPSRHLDSNYVTLRVNMHGMTNFSNCTTDHRADISLTGQPIGSLTWDGQTAATFEKKFYISGDSIQIFPVGNKINVFVEGESCPVSTGQTTDEIRVNWYEFDYWRLNRVSGTNFSFKIYSEHNGINRYWLWNWLADTMRVYIPSKSKMINNVQKFNDDLKSFLFMDTVEVETEYFCYANDSFLVPDSILKDEVHDLRNLSNGADVIIITHPDFIPQAERYAQFREQNMPDSNIVSPRIMVVNVQDIYDEFSAGLLSPYSIQTFIKYAFENWQTPAPAYVVLFGDMSYDYRGLLENGRPNYIPSIPYFQSGYGQAASDNMFVAVAGEDVTPDLAIGRISCETIEEATVLVDKIVNYPDDSGKEWQQNILLFSSGIDEDDENTFHFNDANETLGNLYINPIGGTTSKVYRYPNEPQYIQYQGDGLTIREKINQGGVIANYYGHGGGLQWDLIFTNDDIYELQNEGRLPFILSVTCYTAHFDNQNVFGEIFNKVENKGSIGFFGSSGLTYWHIGKAINEQIFYAAFVQKNLIIGKTILAAKSSVPGTGLYGQQVALMTLLGDPLIELAFPTKADFRISSSDISTDPVTPLVGDSVSVKVKLRNLGIIENVLADDSVSVELLAESPDTSYSVGINKVPNFGENDSTYFAWFPQSDGLYTLSAKINEDYLINEPDHSDNIGVSSVAVFSLDEPNVIYPEDGFSTNESVIDFLFSDIGYYADLNLTYEIQIDTSITFETPLVNVVNLSPDSGLLAWSSDPLPVGEYFWRSRIFDGVEYGNWSETLSFIILSDTNYPGYYAKGKVLETFTNYNMNYSDSLEALILNTEIQPPRPSETSFIEDIIFVSSILDTVDLTTVTTDGKYIYFANIWFFALDTNPEGNSFIYKVGTGNNGTIKGEYYGTVPGFYEKVYNSIFYLSDGYLYVSTGNPYYLRRIEPETGQADSVYVPDGLLSWDTAKPDSGACFVTSDGQYVYNLTLVDTLGNNKYIVRIFDPSNNWQKLRDDLTLSGQSFEVGFSGFFIADNYLYTAEYFYNNKMRRYNLSDGAFIIEWRSSDPFESYYAWTYDWQNDRIYSTVYRASGYSPKFSKFFGSFVDAEGNFTTEDVGPVYKWNSVKYLIDFQNTPGSYSAGLEAFNNQTNTWDTLVTDIPDSYDLSSLDADLYTQIRLYFTFTDSTFGNSAPLKFKSLNVDYESLPEVIVRKDDLAYEPDTLMQGFTTTFKYSLFNIGKSDADSITLNFYLNDSDTATVTRLVNIPSEATVTDSFDISTVPLLFDNEVELIADNPRRELFSYNNIAKKSFYVSRDSISPEFRITFDGKEIIDGDIVSAKPEVIITLEDNSPLPLDSTFFTIVNDDIPLDFSDPDLNYHYTPYPNSKSTITWTPTLNDGEHTLEILAKDASGNFFDTTSYRINFNVFNEADIIEVYNYPNPFTDNTYFTFILHGTDVPDELKFKIYTIAGRLIRDIEVPTTDLLPGFHKVFWDGRDQDGDEIANGLYFYKTIYKNDDVVKSVTQKLVKMK
ncbi:MAG: hypothetical protein Kow0098_17050 [Ignavibacteriaceae bacterium]